jgi:hypothetical protein
MGLAKTATSSGFAFTVFKKVHIAFNLLNSVLAPAASRSMLLRTLMLLLLLTFLFIEM